MDFSPCTPFRMVLLESWSFGRGTGPGRFSTVGSGFLNDDFRIISCLAASTCTRLAAAAPPVGTTRRLRNTYRHNNDNYHTSNDRDYNDPRMPRISCAVPTSPSRTGDRRRSPKVASTAEIWAFPTSLLGHSESEGPGRERLFSQLPHMLTGRLLTGDVVDLSVLGAS